MTFRHALSLAVAAAATVYLATFCHGCGGGQKPKEGTPLATVCFHGLLGDPPKIIAACAEDKPSCEKLREAAKGRATLLADALEIYALGECR